MRNATDVFSEWALGGKDEGMEKTHAAAVSEMLTHLLDDVGTSFTFIDAGCGNGWAVRKMKEHPFECVKLKGEKWDYLEENLKKVFILFRINLQVDSII